MELTLLELSLDDAKITANAPFSGRGSSTSDAPETSADDDVAERGAEVEIETEDGDSKRSTSPILAAIAAVAILGLVVLVKRRRSGSEEIEVE